MASTLLETKRILERRRLRGAGAGRAARPAAGRVAYQTRRITVVMRYANYVRVRRRPRACARETGRFRTQRETSSRYWLTKSTLSRFVISLQYCLLGLKKQCGNDVSKALGTAFAFLISQSNAIVWSDRAHGIRLELGPCVSYRYLLSRTLAARAPLAERAAAARGRGVGTGSREPRCTVPSPPARAPPAHAKSHFRALHRSQAAVCTFRFSSIVF
ncbi:hypothetical protein EVAR_55230_1 [Eumeta japonica]|uniref:Uncharacterized protein n=1 Tax=Eumeta variegata TaxID=151549 RepID=A0A4C1ZNS6_EUMVA|nr:hypothetical protein EVAR_55230_1 [Eumeta japonica]